MRMISLVLSIPLALAASTACNPAPLLVVVTGPSEAATALGGSGASDLWVTKSDGKNLVHFDGSGWSDVPVPGGSGDGASFVADGEGGLWVVRDADVLGVLSAAGDFTDHRAELPAGGAVRVDATQGHVVASHTITSDNATTTRLFRLAGEAFVELPALPIAGEAEAGITEDDAVWARAAAGTFRLDGDAWTELDLQGLANAAVPVADLAIVGSAASFVVTPGRQFDDESGKGVRSPSWELGRVAATTATRASLAWADERPAGAIEGSALAASAGGKLALFSVHTADSLRELYVHKTDGTKMDASVLLSTLGACGGPFEACTRVALVQQLAAGAVIIATGDEELEFSVGPLE